MSNIQKEETVFKIIIKWAFYTGSVSFEFLYF